MARQVNRQDRKGTCYGVSRGKARANDRRRLVICLRGMGVIMLHSSCEGCRYKRSGGVCADPTWNSQQVTDDSPRLCYELPRTLNDSLVLYVLEHEGKQEAKGKA